MGLDVTFKSDLQLAEGGQPRVGALDRPSVAPESVVALDALAGDAILDAPALQMRSAPRVVVALVGMQFVRAAQRPASLATHRRQRIDQLIEDHRVMAVGPGDARRQRDALAVRDEVALAAEFAPVRRVGARVRAPRGLDTLAASMLARLRSSRPALRSSANKSWCRRCQTPAACQSRSRRQHVMPLPKPNSCGSSSHGMPVRSTNTMPLSAISSLTRGRPPLGEGGTTGSNGAIFLNSAALNSLFLFRPMHWQTHHACLPMTRYC